MTVVADGVCLVETVAVGGGDGDGRPPAVRLNGAEDHVRGRVCVHDGDDGVARLALEAERRRGAAADTRVAVRLPGSRAHTVAAELRRATATTACEVVATSGSSVTAAGENVVVTPASANVPATAGEAVVDAETPHGRVVIDRDPDGGGVEISVATRFVPGDDRGRASVRLHEPAVERVATALD